MNKISLDKYKHISFDLDGTLVHTREEYRQKVINAVVKKLGGKIKSRQSINKFWYEVDRDRTIKEEFRLDPKFFWKIFKKVDIPKNRADHTTAYWDAEPTIRFLNKSGMLVSIITGAREWIAKLEIQKLNGAPYDLFISLYSHHFREKPNPGGLEYALKKLNVSADNTLYIGNSNEDAYFAKNARVDFLYLCRKEHDFDLGDCSIGKIHSLEELIS
jgi:HAD superfamily hydrolase (TIGR01549 family)